MKASVKLRDEERKPPLLRLKLPISLFNLPLISAASASSSSSADLALHLRTAIPAGPSLKLTYRPTTPSSPISLSLTSGVGPWASPFLSPLLLSAHFSPSRAPSFTVTLKPQLGDFTLTKSTHSFSTRSKENGAGVYHPLPVSASIPAYTNMISSGAKLSATTKVPVAGRVGVKVRWGVSVSEEAVGRWHGVPGLTVDKVGIEMVDKAGAAVKEGNGSTDAEVMGLWMRKEVEELRRENALIKESIQEMQKMVADGKDGSRTGVAVARSSRSAI